MDARRTLTADPLRVLVYEEPVGWWTAVCLDRYMVGEGRSEDAAIQALHKMMASEIVYGMENSGIAEHLLDDLPKAPDDYWEKFNSLKGSPKEMNMPPIMIKPMDSLISEANPRRRRKHDDALLPSVQVPFRAQARYAVGMN